MKVYYLVAVMILFGACKKRYQAPVPDLKWDKFETTAAKNLPTIIRKALQGVYVVKGGQQTFGNKAVLNWSYQVNENDTLFKLSVFCQKEVVYMLCEGRKVNHEVLLNGYWRNLLGTETGRVRLTVAQTFEELKSNAYKKLVINGIYGFSNEVPSIPIVMEYTAAIKPERKVEIVAHRGGGRTSDLLPASENSLEIIKLASQLGATGVEIDVRLTKDGVPVLYHDATLNERSIQRNGMVGPIENYTYQQLHDLVRLPNGERIPTLREALQTIVESTELKFVWLDTKFKGTLLPEYALQQEFLRRATALNRQVNIAIGIPDELVLQRFKELPNFKTISSVCELTPADVQAVEAAIWAPRWTLGLQHAQVAAMHNEGRQSFVWTLDVPDNISKYLKNSEFDGILSNYAPYVAFCYYAQ